MAPASLKTILHVDPHHENVHLCSMFYRNREVHLAVWLLHLHPFLQKQNLAYTVFVVNQVRASIPSFPLWNVSGAVSYRSTGKLWCYKEINGLFNLELSPLFTCKISRLGNYQKLSFMQFLKATQIRKWHLWTRCLWHWRALTAHWQGSFAMIVA